MPIKVFISYSHDSDKHRLRVLELSDRLREDGIDCIIDQYINGAPPQGWLRWMEQQVESADFVLVFCTELYLKRFKGEDRDGGRGVNFEGAIISQILYDEFQQNTKFYPVIPDQGMINNVPLILRAGSIYKLNEGYESLYRVLTAQPRATPKPLGKKKHFPLEQAQAKQANVKTPSLSMQARKKKEVFPKNLDPTGSELELHDKVLPFVYGVTLTKARDLQNQSAKSSGYSRFFSDKFSDGSDIGPELAVIPEGLFRLGSANAEPGRKKSEGPLREIRIENPFAMSRFLISVSEFRQFAVWDYPIPKGLNAAICPCFGVNRHMAIDYAEWLSNKTGQHYRLPSEAEWEYAARGGTATRFSFGNEVDQTLVNFLSKGSLVAIGSLPANPWGLHEVHGNLWEWTLDQRHTNYSGHPGSSAPWSGTGKSYVLRGGSWQDPADSARSASRTFTSSSNQNPKFGFRLVRELSN